MSGLKEHIFKQPAFGLLAFPGVSSGAIRIVLTYDSDLPSSLVSVGKKRDGCNNWHDVLDWKKRGMATEAISVQETDHFPLDLGYLFSRNGVGRKVDAKTAIEWLKN